MWQGGGDAIDLSIVRCCGKMEYRANDRTAWSRALQEGSWCLEGREYPRWRHCFDLRYVVCIVIGLGFLAVASCCGLLWPAAACHCLPLPVPSRIVRGKFRAGVI